MRYESLYCCPDCKNSLIGNEDKLTCPICKNSWNISSGIPDFAEHDLYWNQVPKEKMQEILNKAEDVGWTQSVEDLMDKEMAYTKRYIIDESRADWHYYVPATQEVRILDVGAGWGAVSIALARHYKVVFATDTTLETLKFINIRARQEGVNNIYTLRLNPLDFPNFPFKDGYFDLAVLNGVLEWVGQADMSSSPSVLQENALKAILNILKPGGSIYIGIENRFYIGYLLGQAPHGELPFVGILPRKVSGVLTRWVRKTPHRTYIYSMRGYRRLLEDAGFSDVNFYWIRPDYRFPRTIIPLEYRDVIRYWTNNIMISKKFTHQILQKFLYNLPGYMFCNSFGIVARKPMR